MCVTMRLATISVSLLMSACATQVATSEPIPGQFAPHPATLPVGPDYLPGVGASEGGAAARSPRPVHGKLSPEQIQAAVRAQFSVFRRCYEDGLRRDPTLQGLIVTKFVIGRDGRVNDPSSGVVNPDRGKPIMPDREVVRCVVEGFKTIVFPPPEGGIVTVTYPIMFSIQDDGAQGIRR